MRKLRKSSAKSRLKKPLLRHFKPNDDKFRELVIFIAERSESDPHFGAIKLNKLLFYCDFLAYLKLGKPITGQPYFKLEQGPAPRYGTRIREQMVNAREIGSQRKKTINGIQVRTVALRPANPDVFSSPEIALITEVLQTYRASSGSELSEKSHKFAGWYLADDKETIPYAVALVGNRLPMHSEIQKGITLEATAAACLTDHASQTA